MSFYSATLTLLLTKKFYKLLLYNVNKMLAISLLFVTNNVTKGIFPISSSLCKCLLSV